MKLYTTVKITTNKCNDICNDFTEEMKNIAEISIKRKQGKLISKTKISINKSM